MLKIFLRASQYSFDGELWQSSSETLISALDALLDLILAAYQAEAPSVDRLGAFIGRDFFISLLDLTASSIEFEVSAVLTTETGEGMSVETSSVRANRQYNEVSAEFLGLIETIAGEFQP